MLIKALEYLILRKKKRNPGRVIQASVFVWVRARLYIIVDNRSPSKAKGCCPGEQHPRAVRGLDLEEILFWLQTFGLALLFPFWSIHQVPWSGHFRGRTQPPDFVPHVPLSVSVGPGICTPLVSEEARGNQVQTIPVNLATPHLGPHACVALMGLQGTGRSRRRTSTRWVPFSCSELSPPRMGTAKGRAVPGSR